MFTHRPTAPLRKRALSAAVAMTTAAILSGAPANASAAAPAKATAAKAGKAGAKHRSKKKADRRAPARAQRGDSHTLIVRWTGVPKAGEYAGQTISDSYAFGGRLFFVGHRTSAPDFFSIWGGFYDTGISSLGSVDEEVNTWPTKNGGACTTSATWLSNERAYADGFQRSVEQIEEWRTDAKSRGALPAGPAIGGRATVSGTVAVWPTLDRTGAVASLDAQTGQVLRVTPLGLSDASVDLSAWSVAPGTRQELLSIADDPELNAPQFATELCR